MTQDEVDLIYDYLHENYEYVDGSFIHRNKDRVLEGFCIQSGRMRASLYINNKTYYVRYSALIWIYHHKEVFYSFSYRDGNEVNNRIENLIPLTTTDFAYVRRKPSKGFRETILKNGVIRYVAEIYMGTKSFRFGTHNTKEQAINAYKMAKELWINKRLPPQEIRKILVEKKIINERAKEIKTQRKRKGYSFDRRDGRYYACHYINNKRISLGSFDNPEEAHQSYLKAKAELAK